IRRLAAVELGHEPAILPVTWNDVFFAGCNFRRCFFELGDQLADRRVIQPRCCRPKMETRGCVGSGAVTATPTAATAKVGFVHIRAKTHGCSEIDTVYARGARFGRRAEAVSRITVAVAVAIAAITI